MSPLYTVCHRHRQLVSMGERCKRCQADSDQRRAQRNHEHGRTSNHWRSLSLRMIRQHRSTFGPRCPNCMRPETASDQTSKLTLDLMRGGDHTTAREDECRVICRHCHGQAQGGRGAREGDGGSNTPKPTLGETQSRPAA